MGSQQPIPGELSAEMPDIPISTVDSPSVVLELIYQLKIKDVMATAVITGSRRDSMRHIQALMRENHITGIPIIEGQRLLGIVSIDDIVIALDKGYIDQSAEERMTKDVIVLEDDMPLSFAISYLNKYRYGRFPVLNKNKELVGILTSSDVIKTLLVEMNREVLRLEKMHQSGAGAVSSFSEMEFTTVRYDFELAGRASTEIKKALKQRNIDPKIIRRVAIASYELEINQVVHSLGGTISCSIQPDKVVIVAADTGPGIRDVNLALQEGWSTANEWIRSLGFGAGMGLANTKRVSDEFQIESEEGKGTTVRSVVFTSSPREDGG
ncbi:MAG: CBS domain-containing protein [Spirochaetaceae bacterium]|jgi:CBS domain-containing protein/anti-sigma regulatory factor (Ser/Thr protein kinase)|nr:CBS domain-containing protein [Spirochaetaceae bacterium]